MLDTNTKRKIDNARDILVGKVPIPKSQIDLITITLIYKFMDDMDRQAEEFGGKASFFVGDFEKYAWGKVMSQSLSGYERLQLFDEGLIKMNQNPHIPELFRDIFKNAFLPFRDPETLNMFLEELNGFEYSHSEKLGDAFEYLLSIMSSQGDAGQFRTPRHIIEFIVDIVNPSKTDTILDPACGTAGFLISAFKHIMEENTEDYFGDMLNSDEREKIVKNIVGYDISPDMVRLSLVNMFLHKFPNPQIFEYDSLTSQSRWDDNFSCILANPPFMSPKGGIKPHERYAIKSKRSEVLFVDYMMEHLTEDGKAGIIVPEGIIFQSQKAHKELRKKMVEDNFLWAVISLPAGVFQPYSGVKTSILLFDKMKAKSTDKIIFAKVENDGFSLGSQRQPIEKNDLPRIIEALSLGINKLEENEDRKFKNITIVEKTKLAENDYNLSGDSYFEEMTVENAKWNFVELKNFATLLNGRAYKKEELLDKGETPVLRVGNFFSNRKWYYSNLVLPENKYCEKGDLLYAWSASFGPKIWNGPKSIYHYHIWKVILKENVNKMFLYYLLLRETTTIKASGNGLAMMHATKSGMEKKKFPLPPLEIQEEIVAEIENYQKIIDGAKQVVENYKPHIDIDPEWDVVELGEVCEVNPKKSEVRDLDDNTSVSFVPMADLQINSMNFEVRKTRLLSEVYKGYTYFKNKDVLLARVTPCFENGKIGIANSLSNGIGFGSSEYFVFRCSEKILPQWVFLNLITEKFKKLGILSMSGTGGLQRVSKNYVIEYKIPLPSLEIQEQVIQKIEEEQKYVDGCKKLIEIYKQKIKDRIDEVWEG
jgi:type I restriction enzyme M protein